jgi:hypothetical protein
MRKTTYRLPNISSLYDAHDVDGMLALCADGALGRYAPYGRESVAPIRGGIDVIWRAFPNAVPNFRVKVIELIPAEGVIIYLPNHNPRRMMGMMNHLGGTRIVV